MIIESALALTAKTFKPGWVVPTLKFNDCYDAARKREQVSAL
jgi:hypothetical protein